MMVNERKTVEEEAGEYPRALPACGLLLSELAVETTVADFAYLSQTHRVRLPARFFFTRLSLLR